MFSQSNKNQNNSNADPHPAFADPHPGKRNQISANTAYFIRNFLIIFQVIFTFNLIEKTVEGAIWTQFMLTLQLMQAPKPNFKEATFHYLIGFLILIMTKLTLQQKIITIMLSITPYGYYEMVLSRT